MSFRAKLTEIFYASGLTQQEFSDKIDEPLGSVAAWIRGKSIPHMRTRMVLARKLGVSPEDFDAIPVGSNPSPGGCSELSCERELIEAQREIIRLLKVEKDALLAEIARLRAGGA